MRVLDVTVREWPVQVSPELVAAAREGDRAALDAVVEAYLPLVYNIAGRALSSDADADDVVQETMVRVIRGIAGLREPERLRSWLVAVTVNQVREHYRRREVAPAPLEEYDRADPAAEFVEVALSRLHLAEQRREVDEAARWLDPSDRELLAVWTLERAGELSRAEVADALDLNAHTVTVRVSRLKGRLETIRLLVRALQDEPRCAGLARAAQEWNGQPNPLWRKRLLRHVDECGRCRRGVADAMPVERILTGAALLTVPAGYLPSLLENLGQPAIAPVAHLAEVTVLQRIGGFLAAKPALTVAAAVVVCAAVGVTGAQVFTPDHSPAPPVAQAPAPEVTTSQAASPSAAPGSSVVTSSVTPTSTSAAPAPPPPATPAERVLTHLNAARAKEGLPPLTMDLALVTAGERHNQAMIAGCGLSHRCSGEADLGDRITAAGARWSSVGENVAMGGPVANAADPISAMAIELNQSMIDERPPDDGHRKNILSRSFTRVGIVVTRDGKGTVWMTQDFAG